MIRLALIATLAYVAWLHQQRFDSLQADINLLNADVQALDYLRRPAQPENDAPKRRTEWFI